MYSDADAYDVIYMNSETNLFSPLTLHVDAHQHTVVDTAILNNELASFFIS